MSVKIGYYVHHHGVGHLSRALAIAEHMAGQLTLLGTGLAGRCQDFPYIELPDDRMPGGQSSRDRQSENFPNTLHYAPLYCDGIRQRAAALTGWMASHRPDLLVVDVSVEVAMLARLASTPVLYFRLAGNRTDAAHLDAFRGAKVLAAPFHQALDNPELEAWVRDKTRYMPGLTPPIPALTACPNTILLVLGTGGTTISGVEIAAAAAATPKLQWRVIGPAPPVADAPKNLNCLGWVADPAIEIARAEIVIGAAGDGVVSSVLAAGRPFICLPQARPYDEQLAKCRRLSAIGAAVGIDAWPAGAEWPKIIAKARGLHPRSLNDLHDPEGPRRATEFMLELARCS